MAKNFTYKRYQNPLKESVENWSLTLYDCIKQNVRGTTNNNKCSVNISERFEISDTERRKLFGLVKIFLLQKNF